MPSNDFNSLKSFFNSFSNEKTSHNAKLFLDLVFTYAASHSDAKTFVIQTSDNKVAIEFKGFEIVRVSKNDIDLLISSEEISENLDSVLKISKVKDYFFPKGHNLYSLDLDMLSSYGNELVSYVKSTINYLKNFENSTENFKIIYQDTHILSSTPEVSSKEEKTPSEPLTLEITEEEILNIIKQEESESLEYKTSLYWSDKSIENVNKNVLIKEISSFFNTNGGNLIYGVSDDKKIVGVGKDLVKSNNSQDTLELNVRDLLEFGVGKVLTSKVKISFFTINELILMVLTVPPSPTPVFSNLYFEICKKHKSPPGPCNYCLSQRVSVTTNKSTQGFFVRNGNRVNMLNFGEMYEYAKLHWPDFNKG
tara:strand:+ start:6237 stop:7331 length:1095 start_codon:yes stop_codon:yes gene_type:complete